MGWQHVDGPKLVTHGQGGFLFRFINVTLIIAFYQVLLIFRILLYFVFVWDLISDLILWVVLVSLIYFSLGVKLLALNNVGSSSILITTTATLRGKRFDLL